MSYNTHRSYLLAQAQVDASALAQQIAVLNPATTFSPLQPLHDTDVSGYLRHAHEQGIISTIEEGRRETQMEFERVLNERVRRDWEARKKKIFEELGERATFLPESRHSAWGHGKQVLRFPFSLKKSGSITSTADDCEQRIT